MYPNIAIANRTYPEHLSETFCDIYLDVYQQRVALKKAGKDNEQQMMKLALNGVYGDSNNKYGPFYDPKYTMTITINGQLSLCMLTEKFMEIEDLAVIQVNTDGVTVKFPRVYFEDIRKIYKEWEETTGLVLEEAIYDKMIIRDVNNYIAVYEGGTKVKRKGAYEYADLGWHQNQSSLVIAKAAEHKLLTGGSVTKFIENHKDHFDFMLRTKVDRSSRLELTSDLTGNGTVIQNVCRYYASNSNDRLVKVMKPLDKGWKYLQDESGNWLALTTVTDVTRAKKNGYKEVDITFEDALDIPELHCIMERKIGIDKDWNVTVCNSMDDFKGMQDINYDYYIHEANKLVNNVMNKGV